MGQTAFAVRVVTILAALAGPAGAGPSFDCHTNKSLTEQVICADAQLGDLDTEMANLYFRLANDSRGRDYQQLQAEQRDWLKERDSCGADVGCLRAIYRDRIEVLDDMLGPGD